MFIKFKKLRYKNFLGTGNKFTEIQIDKTDTTLCYGENASGKTTLVDAVFFALYGKSFRKANKKADVINYINKKNTQVELEFSIRDVEYKIVRGMKPNIFEVYKNDVLLPQDSTTAAYQKYLESYIIQMPEKLFTQTVLLGATNYTPFMLLSAPDRRVVIESLLDIQIFSTMNEIAKDKNRTLQKRLVNTEYVIEKDKLSIEHIEDHINTIKGNKEDMLEDTNEKIVGEEADIKVKRKEIEAYNHQMLTQMEKRDKLGSLPAIKKMIQQVENYKSQFQTKYDGNIKKINFYHNNDSCPSCQQEIDDNLKADKIAEYNDSNHKFVIGIDKADETIAEQNAIIEQFDDHQHEIDDHISDIKQIQTQIENHYTNIEKLKKHILSIENSSDTTQKEVDLANHKSDLATNEANLAITQEQLVNYETVLYLLKDGGIKSRIIKTYIPVINQLIKKYLEILEFPIMFKFDEEFNDYIKVRGRDEISFPILSEGERSRVNLALMFAFRELAKLRNATHTNFLIFDEIADSSLDIEGWEAFLKIMHEVSSEGNQNVFVISHKSFIMDRFTRSIQFAKKGGRFSEIIGS